MTASKLPASILPLTVIKKKIILSPAPVIHFCSLPPQKKKSITKSLTGVMTYVYSYGVNMSGADVRRYFTINFESDTLVEPNFCFTIDYT